jgi:hypothetical protein
MNYFTNSRIPIMYSEELCGPNQIVPRALSLGLKWPVKLMTDLYLVPRLRIHGALLLLPVCLHDVVLN